MMYHIVWAALAYTKEQELGSTNIKYIIIQATYGTKYLFLSLAFPNDKLTATFQMMDSDDLCQSFWCPDIWEQAGNSKVGAAEVMGIYEG